MTRSILKVTAAIGLFAVGVLTAAGVLRASPSHYAELVGAILVVGGVIVAFLPDNPTSEEDL